MRTRLLIVEPEPAQALEVRELMIARGHSVQVAHTFEHAIEATGSGNVDLLIASVRLGRFNGLHLIIRTRMLHPDIQAILIGEACDRCVDAERLKVPFVTKPVDGPALVDLVERLTSEAPGLAIQRRWPRKHAHLPAVVSNAALEIVEMSYGGLRLKGSAPPAGVGSELVVTLPSHGLSITAVARWTKPEQHGSAAWCGAEIVDQASIVTDAWRGVVDSLN